MTTDCDSLTLRRSFAPYVGVVFIFTILSIISLVMVVKKSDVGFIFPVVMMSLFVVFIFYIGTRYKISLINGLILQSGYGIGVVNIDLNEIDRIASECSVERKNGRHRPFRRITIYGNQDDLWIDVSIKHFNDKDIQALLACIALARPDLSGIPDHVNLRDKKR